MKLISTESGQTLDLMNLEEMRPSGGLYAPDLVQAVVERYAFVTRPTDLFESTQTGYKFSMGKMLSDSNVIEIKQLDIYRDGLIAIATSTDYSDAVLDDLKEWAKVQFGFSDPIVPARRSHSSGVVVEFDQSINSALKNFTQIVSAISSAYTEAGRHDENIGLWRLAFMDDPKGVKAQNQAHFTLERRALLPFSQERYFSFAPLSTGAHLSVLATIETLLGT